MCVNFGDIRIGVVAIAYLNLLSKPGDAKPIDMISRESNKSILNVTPKCTSVICRALLRPKQLLDALYRAKTLTIISNSALFTQDGRSGWRAFRFWAIPAQWAGRSHKATYGLVKDRIRDTRRAVFSCNSSGLSLPIVDEI